MDPDVSTLTLAVLQQASTLGDVSANLQALDAAAGALRDALDSADPAACLRGAPVRPVFAVR